MGDLVGIEDGATVVINGVTYTTTHGVVTGLAAMTDNSWTATAVPSINGQEILVDVSALPSEAGEYVEAFEVRVGSGSPVTLRHGNSVDKPRNVILPSSGTHSVYIRAVYRSTGDRVTNTPGVWSEAKSVTGVTGTPTVTITRERTRPSTAAGTDDYENSPHTAPCAEMFTALVSGFEQENPHDIQWKWNYGDPGSTDPRVDPELAKVFGNGMNETFDPIGAHAYATPGTYTVTLTCTDGAGNTASGTMQIVIADPDTVFSGTDTICIDPSGGTTGGPSGCSYVTSISAANSATGSNDKRWLLARGHTYDLSGVSVAPDEFQIGAYGTGADPLITLPPKQGMTGEQHGWAYWGLNFQGAYDPTNPSTVEPIDGLFRIAKNHTLYNCRIAGFGTLIKNTSGQRFYVASCEMTDWHNFAHDGTAGFQQAHCYVGGSIYQNPNAINKPDGYGPNPVNGKWYPDHGPYRTNQDRGPAAFIRTMLFSNGSWAGDEAQVNLRRNSLGIGIYDFVVSQCLIDNPGIYIGTTAGNAGSNYMDAKVSKCHIIVGNAGSGGMVSIGCGGTIVENCVFVRPVNNYQGRGTLFSARRQDTNDYATYGFDRNRPNKSLMTHFPPILRNCTFADEGASGSWAVEVIEGFASFPRISCIEYGPNVTGLGAATNLDTTDVFNSKHLGRRILGENGDAMQTEYANDDAGRLFTPLTGSDAIGSATGEVAVDDMYGNLRAVTLAGLTRSTPSKGPFEPALES